MADLKVTIEQPAQEPQVPQNPQQDKVTQPVDKNSIKMNFEVRRSLDGNIMIFDHKDIDIIVSPKKLKIVAFTKGDFSDFAYASQNRMFEFLVKKGIIDPQTIKGGHVYGSFEGTIYKPKDENLPLDQIVILNIGKWIEEEKPHMEFDKKYEENFTEFLTGPDEEDSTELGEVPQESNKGTIPNVPLRRYVG